MKYSCAQSSSIARLLFHMKHMKHLTPCLVTPCLVAAPTILRQGGFFLVVGPDLRPASPKFLSCWRYGVRGSGRGIFSPADGVGVPFGVESEPAITWGVAKAGVACPRELLRHDPCGENRAAVLEGHGSGTGS